ncbi:hypothetical protein RQM47_15095 [Rubrivirga sp. S365]|uniref:Uncharacterized protein n=1 Tax=Rubrivirga litoralis TaxID=3075598 RepID=A0ABU3BT54_9BACT|nr:MULTISPECIES: hypothetical protein [unclassified Rubrivirga]MDT0632471.1 hypothetical protein [Rubrivirga sp. F394]MDT7857971.1 hypothetical protein [Rubrivirga sp. S365]
MGRLPLAVFLLVAGCGVEPPEPPATAPPHDVRPALREGRAAPVVFDTTEPPEVVVRIPEVPDAPTPRGPQPSPRPEPPPPAPPGGGPSGSCDVRATEGYCFAYTGAGWTPRAARANCAGAPAAAFEPGACPLAERIATCAFRRPSEPDREILYTYYAPADLVLVEIACPGTFTVVGRD